MGVDTLLRVGGDKFIIREMSERVHDTHEHSTHAHSAEAGVESAEKLHTATSTRMDACKHLPPQLESDQLPLAYPASREMASLTNPMLDCQRGPDFESNGIRPSIPTGNLNGLKGACRNGDCLGAADSQRMPFPQSVFSERSRVYWNDHVPVGNNGQRMKGPGGVCFVST